MQRVPEGEQYGANMVNPLKKRHDQKQVIPVPHNKLDDLATATDFLKCSSVVFEYLVVSQRSFGSGYRREKNDMSHVFGSFASNSCNRYKLNNN